MGILNHISVIFHSKVLGVVDRVEDPRETLAYACQRQEDLLAEVRRSLVEVTASKHQLAAQIQRLEQRAPQLEDQAARYHRGRHELTINADFRAITDLISHWQDRYRGIAGARTAIEAQVREWCEQILVEVVLAARNSSWTPEQLDALLSPGSLTAALLPRHLLYATLQKRLAQKLGAPRNPISATTVRSCAIDESGDRNGHEGDQ